MTYKAIILGKIRAVQWRNNQLEVAGESYLVDSMNMSLGVFKTKKILSIEALVFKARSWHIDDRPLAFVGGNEKTKSQKFTYLWLRQFLSRKTDHFPHGDFPPLPSFSDLRKRPVAVAFANEYHRFSDGVKIRYPIFLSTFEPAPGSRQDIIKLGRIDYRIGFDDVWVDGEHFDLRKRRKAKACLQYLIENKAFTATSARHLDTEIDPFVREQSGGLPKAADIRIHHYFTAEKNRLEKLRSLICRAGNGRFFLKLT
jgi:hypothetical protein